MSALMIDGKAVAARLRERVAAHARDFEVGRGRRVGLAVVIVGDDPASQVYVGSKLRETEAAGMASFEYRLPEATSEAALLSLVRTLNEDDTVDGILVQLPLPKALGDAAERVIATIDPSKDVDGLHPTNAGRLVSGLPGLAPCTPLGATILIDTLGVPLAGAHAVVLGRSNLVGKPVAHLLLRRDATVTIAHSRTRDLPALCRTADVLVAAVGRPHMVARDWVKPGAIVIDVGINRLPPATEGGKGRLVGDVDTAAVAEVARAITPVPGGVGPMTVACLLANTMTAAHAREGLAPPDLKLA